VSFLQHLFGNATEIDPAAVQAEFQPVMVNEEAVAKAFKLFRDLLIMTNLRLS